MRIFINLIDSLQKENEELLKNLEFYIIQGSNIKLEIYIKDNFIEKKKIKNKIEELTKEGRHYNANKIEVLQELLEGDN